jgi:hypothetical protein
VVAQAGAPALSVIITVYNGEEDLPRALDSLRAQTFDDFELLVVDNGSNDGTWEVIQELSWRRMRAHRLKERRHEVDAFTQALAWAQGQYVVHHGAGDVSEPGRFEQQIARMKRGRTLGAVGAYARWVDAEGGMLREIKPPSGHKAILKWLEREDAEFVLGIARGAAMLNREALEDVGGFRTALGHAAFLDIWLRLAASDYKLANVTTPLYTVQFNPAAPYIRFHAEVRAFATLARDLTKGDGDGKGAEKADGEKAGGAEGEKAGEKASAEGDTPPEALRAGTKPPVDKGDEKPGDRAAAEKGESPESGGKEKPAAAKVDTGGKPPAAAKPAEMKSAPEAGATEQKEKGEGEKAEKPEEKEKPGEAGKSPEAAEKDKSAETKVDEEDKPPAEAKAEPESGEAPDEEKKDKGEKADTKTEKPAEAKSTGENIKAEAGKPEVEGEPPAGKKSAEAGEKSEAGEAEGEKKGEGEEKEDEKPEEEEKPIEAEKAEESAREEKTATAKAETGDEPPTGKEPAGADERSEAGEVEEDKKSEAGDKEDEKPEEKEPVEAGKATEPTEKGLPAKSEGGGKGETPTAQKPAEAGEKSGAGKPEEDKKGEGGEKEVKKPEKSGQAEVDETEVSTEKMTPIERARRLAAERAERGLAARLRERSDNYLAWAGRFEEWGGAAGEHVRQMWTRALLAYPLNPQVWAFAYRRLADRTSGGGDQGDAGPEA